jgi:phosphate starvation-inducible protein PhoH and related proteins
MSSPTLELADANLARVVFGERDRFLKQIEKFYAIEIFPKGTHLTFKGKAENCQHAIRLIRELYGLAQAGFSIAPSDVEQSARMIQSNPGQVLSDIFLDSITGTSRNRPITPKTVTQKKYVDSMRKFDVVFGWGPAGTGKTYLAMAMAVAALNNREVERIILTRPAVEAGEKLGFLPGDMAEKVNPYLRPLYDALHDMMNFEKAQQLVQQGTIEVAPLAFMRGRTLNHSFVILDEAQNTTREQMKMFLTRLGFDSKAVITGDVTQIDLPDARKSGLSDAISRLQGVEGISCVEFDDRDVVRHPLVRKIIEAYEGRAG